MFNARNAVALLTAGFVIGLAGVCFKSMGSGFVARNPSAPVESRLERSAPPSRKTAERPAAAARSGDPGERPAGLLIVESRPRPQPDIATARHVLIAFKGAAAGLSERSQEEARALAYELADRLRQGDDVELLIDEHSDDPSRGTDRGLRRLCNFGLEVDLGETARDAMPRAYGDVLFALAAGDCAVADYDPARCPLGYFVIKRSD
jgi:parvulin-like peptidyl-prolyl isomerase